MNWLTAVRTNKTNTTPQQREGFVQAVTRRLVPIGRGDWLLAGVLFVVWLLVLLTLPAYVPLQLASWLTLIALLIAPGYFLTDMLTWRGQPDRLERLALALPLGIALLALPGITALVLHWTLFQLAVAWIVVSAVVMGGWLLGILQLPLFGRVFAGRTAPAVNRWAVDELLLAALLVALFLVSLPALSQYKIDGDAYAVSTFTAEALADLPLNAREPLFGTEFGPGVRMIFNQFMTLSYLWSYIAVIAPLTLTAVASRNILAI
ncbi:MAG: hypothetical protein KC421_16415, partial [Anaerolineales bacterium]|nr:hypothetical protein [Anaerolineales bacterium]